MAATTSPSHSQHQDHHDKEDQQHQDPDPTESLEAEQPPHSETLETPNPPQLPVNDQQVQNSQQSDKKEDTLLILDEGDQQSQPKNEGTIQITLPIIPTDIAPPPPPPPPLASPTNTQRRPYKRKKNAYRNQLKRKKSTKKFQNLSDIINPIPLLPKKTLDFRKHEEVLKRLGLHDFSKIEFDHNIRTDLLIQLIVNYDPKKRASYVNEFRVNVNRADLARALKLPTTKPEKGSSSIEEVDLDSEVFSDESIAFIDSFVSNYMLLHEDSWVMPTEISNWTRCIRDGHPEKLDPASLIWYMVEKELTQKDKLVDCYYASHLQYLIRSQREILFEEEDDSVPDDTVAEDGEEITNLEEEKQVKDVKEEELEDKITLVQEIEEITLVAEHDLELTLGTEAEEIVQEEVKKEDEVMVDADECKAAESPELQEEVEEHEHEQEQGGWLLDGKNLSGDHFLQRCQTSDLNYYEEQKIEELEDEQIEQVEDEIEEEEEEEIEEEQGFDMEANDDTLDHHVGLTDNYLQGVQTSHIPFESHGVSSMDLFVSRDNSFMAHGAPSFFNNGKRVLESEEDINLNINNKRSKPNEIWDQKPNDIGSCVELMQQLGEHVKMLNESREQNYGNAHYDQQMTINQLQERQFQMEEYIKSKNEELEKKNNEVFRLERELYLMADLLSGYRKALNDTRVKFSEYRKVHALKEEPLYKDVGPGGLVLSTRELEKQRLKLEEDKERFVMVAKSFEEECVYKFGIYEEKVSFLVDKLVIVEDEVKKVKEMWVERKDVRKVPEEAELGFEMEENPMLVDQLELDSDSGENQKLVNKMEVDAEPEKDQEANEKLPEEVTLEEDEMLPEEVAREENEKLPEDVLPEENEDIQEEVVLEESAKILEQVVPEENEEEVSLEENKKLPEVVVLEEDEKSLEEVVVEENEKSLEEVAVEGNQKVLEEVVVKESDKILEEVSLEENQKIPEEVPETEAIAESAPPEAEESKEKEGGED